MKSRWIQLIAGIGGMIAVANLQYGWTLFVDPIHKRFHWSNAEIQLPFTLFVLAETWLVPLEAYLVDRIGPRRVVAAGGILVACAWIINSHAQTLAMFCLGNVIGGVGAGAVYGTAVGNALKWFPDRRGLAAGLTAAGFGAGSAITVAPMVGMIRSHGFETTFLVFGLLQGAVVLASAVVLEAPEAHHVTGLASTKVQQGARDFAPREVLSTPLFWLMFVMMTMASAGGLMAVAQLGPMAKDFGVANAPVQLLGFTMAALPLALSLDRVLNGITRPFFGWVSDQIGREKTMFYAFSIEGFAILLLLSLAHHPYLFVLLSGLTFFAWGEIYSLFPALSADLFGRKYAATNYGMLYTAKGAAALLVPLGGYIHLVTGSWTPILMVAVAFDWTAALLAMFSLRPRRVAWVKAFAPPLEGWSAPIETA